MESPTPEKMKCPTPETLSAVFDRECTEETILRHVRECDALISKSWSNWTGL